MLRDCAVSRRHYTREKEKYLLNEYFVFMREKEKMHNEPYEMIRTEKKIRGKHVYTQNQQLTGIWLHH